MDSEFTEKLPEISLPKELELPGKQAEENDFKSKLAKEMRECGSRSSIHGIPSLSNENTSLIIKFVWILCMTASWAYFIYLFIIITQAYRAYEVISSVSLGYEAPSDFPGN